MIATETKLQIIELRSQSKSIARIAKEVKVSKQTVVDVCKDMDSEIQSLHAIQLETLYEEQKVSTEERIKRLSSLLARIQEELDARTLEDVPTDKLVDMYLKTASALDSAKVEPILKSTSELEEDKLEKEALKSLL